MHNPLDTIARLEKIITELLLEKGLHVEEASLKVAPNGLIAFKAFVTPPPVISESDFDQSEFDRIFNDMVGEW